MRFEWDFGGFHNLFFYEIPHPTSWNEEIIFSYWEIGIIVSFSMPLQIYHLDGPWPRVDFLNCFAPYLRLLPNFWEAFYRRRARFELCANSLIELSLWFAPCADLYEIDPWLVTLRFRSLQLHCLTNCRAHCQMNAHNDDSSFILLTFLIDVTS